MDRREFGKTVAVGMAGAVLGSVLGGDEFPTITDDPPKSRNPVDLLDWYRRYPYCHYDYSLIHEKGEPISLFTLSRREHDDAEFRRQFRFTEEMLSKGWKRFEGSKHDDWDRDQSPTSSIAVWDIDGIPHRFYNIWLEYIG